MEPASSIIKALGGNTSVAKIVGLHHTRVANWKRPREKGGTDGRIPQWHIPKLIDYAARIGVSLDPVEFFAAKPPAPLEKKEAAE